MNKRDKGYKVSARGHVQRQLERDLFLTGRTSQLREYMKAPVKYSKYVESFENLMGRIREEGYRVYLQLGKKGGHWSAFYYMDANDVIKRMQWCIENNL